MANSFGARNRPHDRCLEGFDLHGKRVLVTGVSPASVSRQRARWSPMRDRRRHALIGQGAACARRCGNPLRSSSSNLASLKSARHDGDELLKRASIRCDHRKRGCDACPQGKTQDGFETQFGTNHLGHFVFVNKLVPLLQCWRPYRFFVVGRSSHLRCEPRRFPTSSTLTIRPSMLMDVRRRRTSLYAEKTVALDNR